MTLTVPRARLDPGRAPALAQAVEPSQAGALTAAAGQVVQELGIRIEADRLSRAGQQLQLDLTRDMNALRLEAEEIGDADALDGFWSARSAQLRQTYAERVDPRLRTQFDLQFQELNDAHAFALGRQALALRRSEREAGWLAYADETIRAGAAMDAGTRSTFVRLGRARIDQLVADGTISAEEGERRAQAYAANMDEAAAIRLVNEDPAGFVAALDAGEITLPPADAERYRASALRDLEKQQETAAREADRAVKERLDRIGGISDPGRLTSADRAWLQTPEAQAHPGYARTAAAIELSEEAPGWRTMTPGDLRDLLALERQRPVTEGWQEERAALLREQIEAHEKGLGTDPLAHVAAQGFAIPDLGTFDADDPQAFAAGLARRRQATAQLAEAGWDVGSALMTEPERAALREAASVATDPRERLALAGALVSGLGDGAAGVVRNVTGGDAVLEQAVTLLSGGAPAAAAADMLAGARALADKAVTVPPEADFADAFRRITEDRLAEYPGLSGRVRAAAQAIYAAGSGVPGSRDDPRDLDEERFAEAVQRAMGGETAGRAPRGGMAEIRGGLVPLPIGLPAAEVERALELVREDLVQPPARVQGTALAAPDLSRLAAASLTGAAPDFGEIPQEAGTMLGRAMIDTDVADLFEEYRIEEFWPDGQPRDDYILVRERGGRPVALRDENGQIYRFSLQRLVEAAR